MADCTNCTWSKSNHTHAIAASLTCGNFTPVQVAQRNAGLTVMPDRCVKCNEAITPRVTKGAYLCKCDAPKPPRWVLAEAADKPLTPQVRYGS